jgi:hypothetical protein
MLVTRNRLVIPGPITNLAVAGVANAAVIFTVPVLAGQLVGTKSVRIHAVNIFNNAAGNTQILIGNGVGGAFVALLPALDTFNSLNSAYGLQSDLVEAESFANITAYPVALAGAGTIDIQVEVIIVG